MTFLSTVISGAKALIWGNPNVVLPNPKTQSEIFKENLSKFATLSITSRACVANCIKSVQETLKPEDCDFS